MTKKVGDFLTFDGILYENKKTWEYIITNKANQVLGKIRWYNPWRKYCFYTFDDMCFDAKCLGEIKEFLEDLMRERGNEGDGQA